MLHGDIKSLNYLTTNGGKVIKLADLGMATTAALRNAVRLGKFIVDGKEQSCFDFILFFPFFCIWRACLFVFVNTFFGFFVLLSRYLQAAPSSSEGKSARKGHFLFPSFS